MEENDLIRIEAHIKLAAAEDAIQAGLKKAEELGVQIAIVVVDYEQLLRRGGADGRVPRARPTRPRRARRCSPSARRRARPTSSRTGCSTTRRCGGQWPAGPTSGRSREASRSSTRAAASVASVCRARSTSRTPRWRRPPPITSARPPDRAGVVGRPPGRLGTDARIDRDKVLPDGALLIGGPMGRHTAAGSADHIDPATGKVLTRFALAGAAEVDEAVAAARAAVPAWRAMPAQQRVLSSGGSPPCSRSACWSTARSDRSRAGVRSASRRPVGGGWRLSTSTTTRVGSTSSTDETTPPYSAPSLDYTLPEPYGVVGIIVPWNAPVSSAAAMKVAPALAAGNCVVLKPSELGALTPQLFARVCTDAGLPPGVLNVVAGGPEAGEALVNHQEIGEDQLHGWRADGAAGVGGGGAQPDAGAPRARRQVGQHRVPRRGPRRGCGDGLHDRDRQWRRPGLQPAHEVARARVRLRGRPRASRRHRLVDQPGPALRRRHPDGSRDQCWSLCSDPRRDRAGGRGRIWSAPGGRPPARWPPGRRVLHRADGVRTGSSRFEPARRTRCSGRSCR